MQLEDLRPNTAIRGVHPDGLVTVVSVQWFGSAALELTYKTPAGTVANELLYRHDEARLEVVAEGRPWSFDGDGALFRLVSEAQRIRLAHLFDPLLAVHTSVVDPLPHQITGVYEAMLPRQPLRFLLADDPGAGKTIMAGLLIKELIARGDLERCLIVCPGSLAEQWQDELYRRFQLPFEILTNDKLEAARTRNWFLETDLVIARLDKLSRDEDVQQKLQAPDAGWDLVVCDEAHKLSATFFGGEVKYTKRYRLGQLLSGLTRHFLLMTATPHNGKEQDFQLFLALLDGDRFDGASATGCSSPSSTPCRTLASREPAIGASSRRGILERPECAWIDRDLEQAAVTVTKNEIRGRTGGRFRPGAPVTRGASSSPLPNSSRATSRCSKDSTSTTGGTGRCGIPCRASASAVATSRNLATCTRK